MKHFFTLSFLLFAFSLFAQPANDDCPGIINLGAAPICDDNIIYNNLNATTSDIGFDNIPPCWVGGIVSRDVWFSFVAVDTILDYRITVTACPDPNNNIDPILNPQIAIYRGDCEYDGLQILECSSTANGDGIVDVDLFGLTPGITYFIRINDWSPSGTPNDGAFKLCIIKKPPISTVDQGGSTACSGTLTDSGGPDGDYGNSENFAYTICPSAPHNCINFSLEYYNVESFNSDQINFFDGPTIGSPLIGSISGGDNGGSLGGVCYSVSASSGCLTVQFVSNGSTVFEGFQGFWECTADACQPNQEITVQTGSSPADIVQSVVTGQTSITITNIDCANSALATFQAGSNTDLGLEKGILLTSGSANNVSNPGSFFSSAPTGTPGDADLDYLSTINGNNSVSNDACIVEMDVFASTDEITFEYIFGSEEYPEWVGTSFNDIFAFLVSGPGIVGDPNIGNQDNVATLPDGTFIQINSVNDAQNWQFYRDNQDGQSVAYDGLTSDSLGVKKSLTARIPTIPCNTYHLKFAIADRGDTAFDSGVFISDIKGGSPNLGVNYNSGIQYLVEECVNIPDEVTISLNAAVTQPTTFDIVVSGTATLGTDYLLTIPGSVTFNSGTEVFTFPIQALSDGIPEGTETIIIQLVRDFGCGATILATLEIELQDNLDVQIFEDQLDTVLVCEGNGAQMSVVGAADYFWQPPGIFSDPNISNPIVTPTTSQWVMVTGTLGLCVDVDSVYLNLISPEVNIFPEGIINICETDSITLTATNNVNNSNLLWTTFFFPLTDPNNPVQTIIPPPFFNSIFLEVQVELGGCVATDQVTINIDAFDFPVVANDTTICQNYSVDLATDVIGSSTNFIWTPNIGLSPGNNVSGPIATPDVTTTYTLIGSSATGVCKDTAEVTITVIPVNVEIQNPDTVFICLGENATLNNINTTAGVGITWTPNFFMTQISPAQVVVTPPVTTWYYTTLNAASCTVTDSVLVYVDSLPNLSIMANPAKESYCLGEQVLLTSPTYEPGNFPGITLMWDSEIPGALTPDSFLNLVFIATETHTYVRTTTVNACTSIDSIEIIVVPSTLISIVPPLDTICPGEAVNLMVVGPAELTDFSWEPSGGLSCSDCPNPIASPISTTQYNVTAEFMGCPVGASAGIFVPSGPVFELQDILICPGEQALLNPFENPNATYSWTSSDGSLTTTEPMPTVSPTQTTTYTVTATVGDCVSTGQITVTVATDFNINASTPTIVCPGESVTLNVTVIPAGPNYTYTWNDESGVTIGGDATITTTPSASTTYTIEVSDDNNCFTHSVDVPVEVSLPFTVNAGPDTMVQAGSPVSLMGTASLPGISFTWADQTGIISNEANITITSCKDMLYTLTGTDAAGCTQSDAMFLTVNQGYVINSITVMEAVPNDSIIYEGEEFVFVVNTTPSVLPGATYNWYIGDSLVSTTTDTISAVLNAFEIFGADIIDSITQNMHVEITSGAGCTSNKNGEFSVHNIPIGIPNAFSPNADSKNDSFRIVSLIPLTIDEFKVWNRWGQLVYDNENGPDGWNGKQNDEDAPSDVYIYRVVYQITGGSGKQYTKKGDVTLLR
ncbi:MAG: choice-of-anchor L domain-containing protein [Saprospiraceae bacterium]|nr:choice-of-anchor L domain-containing protein [Saprospiraceae bacterium]MCF8248455.1 choice-of-anchor L domain-containing protein [Saprospiraceae bacterium]MCF8283201.1 choice-of-anchor L domain-containing protein [Bacteroidales bacterium]MCF8309983.1 choice-of-anchor L domain-containing protein [Saprospiraceae bacterium]MCF8438686.1 choice-of-anchor L domain-containing protein [Saprospiraceae bacterium]